MSSPGRVVIQTKKGQLIQKLLVSPRTNETRAILLTYLRDTCQALQIMHSRSEVHGAIDPSRIWCFDEGDVQLLPATREPDTAYAAPERRRGEPLDARADLYPIGVLLHEILTGKAPISATPTPPNIAWPSCPAGLNSLCVALLQGRRDRRPKDVNEVLWRLQELHTVPSDESTATEPPASPELKREDTPPSTNARSETATYEVLEDLGSSSEGRIARAVDLRLGREIILKESLQTNPTAVEQFYREALITARLEHPAIVPIHEVGRWSDGAPFYAMKRINGQPLHEALHGCSLSARLKLLPRLLDAAEAISYAHSKGIVHRNVKPQNILLGEFGETVVIDWGFAKDLQGQLSEGLTETTRGLWKAPRHTPQRTLSGKIVPHIQSAMTPTNPLAAQSANSTLAYMPPEQAEGAESNERIDVYALGAILYHLIAGQPPFPTNKTTAELISQLKGTEPTPLNVLEREAPEELCAIVNKSMARDPEERYQTAMGFCRDLERFLTDGTVKAQRASFVDTLRRKVARYRTAFVIAALFFFALLGVGLYSTQRILEAKTAAEESAEIAQLQHDIAVERLELLALSQARALAEQSPAKALEAIKLIPSDSLRWRAARILAADIMSHSGASTVFNGNNGDINYACLIPNSQAVATAEESGVVQIWDTLLNQTRVFQGQGGSVNFVACAPNGRQIAIANDDKTIRVLDLKSGQSSIIHRTTGVVLDLVFSPDSKRLALADQDGPIELLSLETGKVERLTNPSKVMRAVKFSPDGRYLAAVGSPETLFLFDLNEHKHYNLPNPGDLQRVRFSPDGKWIATASYTQGSFLWSVERHTSIQLNGQLGEVWHLDFSPDSKTLASVGQDKRLWLWDLSSCDNTQEPLPASCGQSRALDSHQGSLRWVSFSDDGRWLATASMDRTTRVWDTQSWESRSLEGHEDVVARAYFLPGAEHLLTTSWDGTLRLWDLQNTEKSWLGNTTTPISAVTHSPDGAFIATQSSEDALTLTNIKTGETHDVDTSSLKLQSSTFSPDGETILLTGKSGAQLRGKDGALIAWLEQNIQIYQGAFSPDGRLIATTSYDATKIQSLSGKTSITLRQPQRSTSINFSPDGKLLAGLSPEGEPKIVIWRSECFAEVAQEKTPKAECTPSLLFDAPDGLNELPVFSPDGRLLTITNRKLHAVIVFDLQTHQQNILPAHGTYAVRQAFSPDSKLLATVGLDTAVRIWSTADWTFRELKGHQNYLRDVAFSPDGNTLVSGGFDQTIRLWDVESGESRSLSTPDKELLQVYFTPQGNEVVSVSDEGAIRVWPDELPNKAEAFWQWLHKQNN